MTKNQKPEKQPILVAVDFSPYSERALVWAARAADRFGVPLVVLHVVHDPGSAPGYYDRAKKHKKHLVRIEEAAGAMMQEFLLSARKKYKQLPNRLDPRLEVGLPTTRILEVAKKVDAQLIVMGSQGRTGFKHMMLGSKSAKVAQLSPVPVTIVKDS